ncbi:hypothetical protein A9Q83_04165 [Alphaproteobacteria bacterium 46_93_T64]|nr:hypothetical protein A9Q83_04165 [Alphaproteobacteria bacterium 46_93_T64]
MNRPTKYCSIIILLVATVFSEGNMANAQELELGDGGKINASELPFLFKRSKILDFVRNAETNSFALAVGAAPCSSYSYSSWGGTSPKKRSVEQCNAFLETWLIDYPQSVVKNCSCNIAILNKKIIDKPRLNNDQYYSILKLYISDASGKVNIHRGFLGYEVEELVNQEAHIYNQNFDEICKGNLDPSLGTGGFKLECFGASMKAEGVMTMKVGLFSKTHSVGNAVLDTGEKFGFITGLNDEDIKELYPSFPDPEPESNSPKQANESP